MAEQFATTMSRFEPKLSVLVVCLLSSCVKDQSHRNANKTENAESDKQIKRFHYESLFSLIRTKPNPPIIIVAAIPASRILPLETSSI